MDRIEIENISCVIRLRNKMPKDEMSEIFGNY